MVTVTEPELPTCIMMTRIPCTSRRVRVSGSEAQATWHTQAGSHGPSPPASHGPLPVASLSDWPHWQLELEPDSEIRVRRRASHGGRGGRGRHCSGLVEVAAAALWPQPASGGGRRPAGAAAAARAGAQ
jgi:hypothetical protein